MGTTMRGDRRCRCRWSRAEVSRCYVFMLCADAHTILIPPPLLYYYLFQDIVVDGRRPPSGRWRYNSWRPSSSSTSRPSSPIAPSSMLRCQRHRRGAGNANAIDATPTTPSVQCRCHCRRNSGFIVNPPSAWRHRSRTLTMPSPS